MINTHPLLFCVFKSMYSLQESTHYCTDKHVKTVTHGQFYLFVSNIATDVIAHKYYLQHKLPYSHGESVIIKLQVLANYLQTARVAICPSV